MYVLVDGLTTSTMETDNKHDVTAEIHVQVSYTAREDLGLKYIKSEMQLLDAQLHESIMHLNNTDQMET